MKSLFPFFVLLSLLFSALFFIVPSFIKPTPKVEVERTFNSSNKELFSYFNDLKKFSTWNYWTSTDSLVQTTYFQPYVGEKSNISWKSEDENFEAGTYKIKKSIEYDSIQTEFTFSKSDKKVTTVIKLKKLEDKKTKLTWTIYPPETSYLGRWYNLYVENFIEDKIEIGLDKLNLLVEGNLEKIAELKQKPGSIQTENSESFLMFGRKSTVMEDSKIIHSKIAEDKEIVKNYLKDSIKISTKELGNLLVVYELASAEQIIKKKRKTITSFAKVNLFIGYKVFDSIKIPTKTVSIISKKQTKKSTPTPISTFEMKTIRKQQNLVQYYKGNFYNKKTIKENFEDYYLNKGRSTKNLSWEEYYNFNPNDSLNSEMKIYQAMEN